MLLGHRRPPYKSALTSLENKWPSLFCPPPAINKSHTFFMISENNDVSEVTEGRRDFRHAAHFETPCTCSGRSFAHLQHCVVRYVRGYATRLLRETRLCRLWN